MMKSRDCSRLKMALKQDWLYESAIWRSKIPCSAPVCFFLKKHYALIWTWRSSLITPIRILREFFYSNIFYFELAWIFKNRVPLVRETCKVSTKNCKKFFPRILLLIFEKRASCHVTQSWMPLWFSPRSVTFNIRVLISAPKSKIGSTEVFLGKFLLILINKAAHLSRRTFESHR